MENSLIRPDPEEFFAGQKIDELLNFYGVIKDNDAAAVEGAVVIVYACFIGGIERSLGSTFTDREGVYFICIPKLPDNNELLGFKVRAGKAYILPEGVDSPGILREHPDEEWVLEQEEILDDEKVGALTEHHGDASVQESKKEESENKEPAIDALTDECTNGQEETGFTVSLSRVDLISIPVVVVPTVQTDVATNISTDSVTLNGSINDTGWDKCDQRKFRFRVQGSESWTDAGIETGSFGPESFSFNITGLNPGATYEFKAMAHNMAGWGQGGVITFAAVTSPEAPAELTDVEVGSSQSNLKRDTTPQKNQYDVYRSTYWNWLRR